MTTALITHPDSLGHATPAGHPERSERIRAIEKALSAGSFGNLLRLDAPLADQADIARCHPNSYIQELKEITPTSGSVALDPDTHLSPGSFSAATRAVGANLKAVDLVLEGKASNVFVACRPPGHHAETAKAMGFCLFGNVAIAAKYVLDCHGLGRVAVIDFDVHHGNGTQDLLWDEDRALFCSTHQMPLFPGTGNSSETGGTNNVVNVPLEAGSAGTEMRAAYENIVFPRVTDFEPDLILVSAGFDAHRLDPLANLNWNNGDFLWLTRKICTLADKLCGGRVVSTLEGGYDLAGLAEGTAAHVKALMEAD